MYKTLQESCASHSFELVLVSPFDLPEEMKQYENIKLIKDFGNPTRCAQIGLLECSGRLVYHCVDDALFYPGSIDLAIDLYDGSCSEKDVVNMRYREGANFSGQEWTHSFWFAHYHDELRLEGIEKFWKISLHPLMSTDYLKRLGGWDCSYEYINHPLHDLMFRVQADGGRIFDSPIDATTCNHYGGRTVDHASIHDAQTYNDSPKFKELYSRKDAAKSRINIPLNNWESSPSHWSRRFKNTIPKSYEDILQLNE
jgi:hypothetical protein